MASNVLSTVSENNDVTEPDFQTALTNLVAAAVPEDSQLIRQIISEYGTLVMELGNLRKTLPETIALLTALRGEVDKIHKRSNGIVIATSIASIIGGGLVIVGIGASPFTVGASAILLTGIGGAIVLGANAGTVSASIYDYASQSSSIDHCKQHQSVIEKHYTAAKRAYTNLESALAELISRHPELRDVTDTANEIEDFEYGGEVNESIVTKKMVCTYVSRGVPIVGAGFSPIARESSALVRLFLPALGLTGKIFTVTGLGITGIGLFVDVLLGIYSAHSIYKGHKCKASQTISSFIRELEHFQQTVNLVTTCIEQKKQLYISHWRSTHQKKENEILKLAIQEQSESQQQLSAANEKILRLQQELAAAQASKQGIK